MSLCITPNSSRREVLAKIKSVALETEARLKARLDIAEDVQVKIELWSDDALAIHGVRVAEIGFCNEQGGSVFQSYMAIYEEGDHNCAQIFYTLEMYMIECIWQCGSDADKESYFEQLILSIQPDDK